MKKQTIFIAGIFTPRKTLNNWEKILKNNFKNNDIIMIGEDYSYFKIKEIKKVLNEGIKLVKNNKETRIIGHSMGGIIANSILNNVNSHNVKQIITIASPHKINAFGIKKIKKELNYSPDINKGIKTNTFGAYFYPIVPFFLSSLKNSIHNNIFTEHFISILHKKNHKKNTKLKHKMKIYSTNRINALGKTGPEQTPEAIKQFLKIPIEHIQVDNDNIEESEQILYNKAKEIFSKQNKAEQVGRSPNPPSTSEATHHPQAKRPPKKPIVFLGGDHSITYPIFKAFQEQNKNPFLIIFDAHADCMPPQEEATHEEFLRAIIEKQAFPSNRIILIGARKIEPEEKAFLNEHNIKVFNEIYDLQAATDYITEKANGHDLYISIDIDALDPAFAPAVSYPEPCGLTSKEFFYIIKRLFLIKSLKAIDIVEAIPSKDKNFDYRTLRLITKIIEEAIKIKDSLT